MGGERSKIRMRQHFSTFNGQREPEWPTAPRASWKGFCARAMAAASRLHVPPRLSPAQDRSRLTALETHFAELFSVF